MQQILDLVAGGIEGAAGVVYGHGSEKEHDLEEA
jgi:hypothetical protein